MPSFSVVKFLDPFMTNIWSRHLGPVWHGRELCTCTRIILTAAPTYLRQVYSNTLFSVSCHGCVMWSLKFDMISRGGIIIRAYITTSQICNNATIGLCKRDTVECATTIHVPISGISTQILKYNLYRLENKMWTLNKRYVLGEGKLYRGTCRGVKAWNRK